MYILLLDENNRPYQLDVNRLICVESINRKLYVCSKDGPFRFPSTLDDIMHMFGNNFVHADKNKIINVNNISRIIGKELHFDECSRIIAASRDNLRMIKNNLTDTGNN